MSTAKELLPASQDENATREHLEFINLNEMLRQSLWPYLTQGRNPDIIVRRSDLPYIMADPQLVREVFNELIRMIFQFPNGNKRFLHIKCEEVVPASRQRQAIAHFRIEFHTNLSTGSTWKELNQEAILACQEKLLSCRAVLHVQEIITTGCLFSISLQGKIL